MRIKPFAFFFSLALMTLLVTDTGCDLTRQAKYASNLAKCDFRIQSVQDVNIAGVLVQNIRSISDMSLTDMARIMGSLTSPTVPLSLQLNLEGRNPNSDPAGLNRLEWVLFIDEIQMTSGVLEKPFVIPGKSVTNIPVQVAVDLKTVLNGKSADAILNFGMNLAGVGNVPTRFRIRLKPTIYVGKTALTYPAYITVKTTYSSQ